VREQASRRVAVLLSSHAISKVANLADRATIVTAGRVVFTGSVPELVARAPAPVFRLRTSDDNAALRVAVLRLNVAVNPLKSLVRELIRA